jgi:citrate lyase beta subunit
VARAIVQGHRDRTLSPFIGIRIKPLNEEQRHRSIRTLDLVHTGLLASGELPQHWVITVPKITVLEQISFLVRVLVELERKLGLAAGTLRFEAMVETPQIVLDPSGRSLLPRLLDVSDGRLRGAHFGTYDFTAGLGITAAYQRMQHPACDFAKQLMQIAFAGTPVWLSDGSTTVLPVAGNAPAVHQAWRLHYRDVRHSLAGGFYQGWDLHPAQLVSRYAALYSFFLEGIDAAGARLRNFLAKAAQATLIGDVFDDAATGQGLLNFFLRGLNSGAITEAEALELTGLTAEEFRGRSFTRIMRARA